MSTFGMLAIAIGALQAFLPLDSLPDGSGGFRRMRTTQEEQRYVGRCFVMDVTPPLSLQQQWLNFRGAARRGIEARCSSILLPARSIPC